MGLVRRFVEMFLQAGISPMSVLRPVGARAPLRRNAPASRHFSHVGTSPRWGSCAASSKCSCKQAFLLASDGMTAVGVARTRQPFRPTLTRRPPPLAQGRQGKGVSSLCHPEHGTQWSGGISLQAARGGGKKEARWQGFPQNAKNAGIFSDGYCNPSVFAL